MAIKRTKKSTSKKNDRLDEGENDENGINSLEENSTEVLSTKKKEVTITREYKTYEADIDFKLKEIPSKEGEILIGPTRLTRFEKARITGARSLQLSLGAPILTKIPSELTDTIIIAKYELEKKTLPISIRRILPNGLYEDIPIEWTI